MQQRLFLFWEKGMTQSRISEPNAHGYRIVEEASAVMVVHGAGSLGACLSVFLLVADQSNAFSRLSLHRTKGESFHVSQQPSPISVSGQCGNKATGTGISSLGLFGLGGGGRSSTTPNTTSTASKARRAIESNAVFKSRMEKYVKGAISAGDLVRSLGRDVADKIPGCDLEDVLAAALEATPDRRKRDLLSKASGGIAIGPGGSTRRWGGSRGGGGDVTIEGRRGQQYLMSQGGERISSGKSSIFNGVEVGKEDTPLKIKVTTRANAALNAAEVRNLETLRAKNGAGAFSKHFVGFTENMDNYNGRGDIAMIMRAGSTDLRKAAELGGGRLSQNQQRKYASQMASAVRCVHKAGLVWTDLKVDNMVLFARDEVKAIDLESAVPARSAPKSYTPATMPPDFAAATRGGFAGVTVDRSFDVWGLGMAVLHLYNGKSYFEGSSDPQTIAKIGQTGFSVDLSGVRDGRTKGLLEGLLDPDPQKRLRYFASVGCRLALM